jgi:hypothetical protein
MWAYCPISRIPETEGMMAAWTSGSFLVLDGYRTAFDSEGFPVDKSISDLPACRFDNPAKRLT